jgi:hypothetical protein
VSTTISLAMPRAPRYAEWWDALDLDDVRCLSDDLPSLAHFPDQSRSYYREGRSTRTTGVELADGTFTVRVHVLASRDDVELAVRIAERTAALVRARTVEAEHFGEVAPARLAALYDTAWTDDNARSGARVAMTLIAKDGGPIGMPGPHRTYYLGKRTLGELGPVDDFHVRLLAAMHALQWHDARTAATFVGKRDARDVTIAAWVGERVVFPKVDYAGIALDDDAFMIPSARVPELAGARWQWLDECQGAIAAIADDEWAALVTRARAHAL